MALPSNIPTSFVPKSAGSDRKYRTDLTGMFGFLAYFLFVLSIAGAVGVFFYGKVLDGSKATKDAQLAKAEASIDIAAVEGYVRLSNRLTSGQTLLSSHAALSQFFSLLETLVPTSVRLNMLHLSVDDTGTVKLDGSGTARSFNALAAVSTLFAKDGQIKNAIFSNISVNAKDNSVSFALSASLDPSLIAYTAAAPNPAAAVPSTNTSTSTP